MPTSQRQKEKGERRFTYSSTQVQVRHEWPPTTDSPQMLLVTELRGSNLDSDMRMMRLAGLHVA